MEHGRNLAFFSIVLSLLHSLVDVQLLYSLTFDMNTWHSYDVRIAICSAELLSSSRLEAARL